MVGCGLQLMGTVDVAGDEQGYLPDLSIKENMSFVCGCVRVHVCVCVTASVLFFLSALVNHFKYKPNRQYL